jgi:hypothetical protein
MMIDFEDEAAKAEQATIKAQRQSNAGVSFIEHQVNSWTEIRQFFDDSKMFSDNLETPNGPGSTVALTQNVREWLPEMFQRYRIETMLDAPCGDLNWLHLVDLGEIEYLGWDCEPTLIDMARSHAKPNMFFERVNLLTVPHIPYFDLILSRDFLAHLPNEPISVMLQKFKDSGSRYLLTSHYPGADNVFDYQPETWSWFGYAERAVNFCKPPFDLGGKLDSVQEQEGPAGNISEPHELALFRLND